MGCHGNYYTYIVYISLFFISCSNSNVEEALNELNYKEAKSRLENLDISWKYALLNNKIAFEAKMTEPINIDSILSLVNKDSTFSMQSFESFYRKIHFFHPEVSMQLIQIEINQHMILKSYFFTKELLNLLQSKKHTFYSFAFEQFYFHLNPKNSVFLIPEIKEIKKRVLPSFRDSLNLLVSHLSFTTKTNKGVFIYKNVSENDLSEQLLKHKTTDQFYSILISGSAHGSYRNLKLLLQNDSIRTEYKRALISSFNHTSNDSLAFVLLESFSDIIQLKLLSKIVQFSNDKLLQRLFRMHNINEHLQSKTASLILKWKKNDVIELLKKTLYSEDKTELIHAIYFAGMHHLREFKGRVNALKTNSDKLIKYEAERASYRLN